MIRAVLMPLKRATATASSIRPPTTPQLDMLPLILLILLQCLLILVQPPQQPATRTVHTITGAVGVMASRGRGVEVVIITIVTTSFVTKALDPNITIITMLRSLTQHLQRRRSARPTLLA